MFYGRAPIGRDCCSMESDLIDSTAPDDLPPLMLSSENICYIIVRARGFEIKEEEDEADPHANPNDTIMESILGDDDDDPIEEELTVFIDSLSEDEQIDLVAMVWLGRGDGSIEDWYDLRQQAANAHNKRTAAYVLGIPLLPDYLDEAMVAFGRSCE